MENAHGIENEKILLQTDSEMQFEFTIPASSDFFDGHFPEFKLLPAVAQFEVVTRFAKKYFGAQRFVPKINRIKFSAPIRPDTTVQLKLTVNKEKQSMAYSLWDSKVQEKVYSSGTFSVVLQGHAFSMNAGFVIPVFNHGATIADVVRSLEQYKLPIVVVDDGNDEVNKAQIVAAVNACPHAVLVTRQKNGGKGSAMILGVLKAHELGLSHVFQIDSDGQHDANRVPFFLGEAERFPDCVICGYPEYDESVPRIRKKAREISNNWARVCSLSGEIVDAMCGFRIYPTEPYYQLLKHHACIDSRMGYDADILVHLIWKGVRIKSYPVKVTYPADGISNFRMVRDNVHISLSFAKLFLGMIVRLPLFAVRALARSYAHE